MCTALDVMQHNVNLPKAAPVVVDDGLVISTVDLAVTVSVDVVLIGCLDSVETLVSVDATVLVRGPVELNGKHM